MLDDAADVLSRLARGTGRELMGYAQKDLEPVSDGIIVGYACTLRGHDGVDEHVTIYVNTSPDAPVDEHTVRLTDRATGQRLTAWTYPQDPSLPSLPAVSYPEAAGVVLAKFGIEADGATLSMESYRPGKRAVLKVDGGAMQHFVKIVQPALASTIHDLHTRLHDAGLPVPRSLGYSDAGLVLLERQTGVPASSRIEAIAHDARFLDELDAHMRRFAAVPVPVGARESLARRADWYADRMAETTPLLAARTAAIVRRIDERYRASPVPAPVTVHGDLHLGQLLVDDREPWRIVGIIDVDTAGKGDPCDDAGALYGHVLVSALEREQTGDVGASAAFASLARVLRSRWSTDGRTSSIAATHLVGHALALAGRGDAHVRAAAQLLDEAETALG